VSVTGGQLSSFECSDLCRRRCCCTVAQRDSVSAMSVGQGQFKVTKEKEETPFFREKVNVKMRKIVFVRCWLKSIIIGKCKYVTAVVFCLLSFVLQWSVLP